MENYNQNLVYGYLPCQDVRIVFQPRGVQCTKHVRVHVSAQEGFDLDLVVLRIHTINTFRTEKIHVYLH